MTTQIEAKRKICHIINSLFTTGVFRVLTSQDPEYTGPDIIIHDSKERLIDVSAPSFLSGLHAVSTLQ